MSLTYSSKTNLTWNFQTQKERSDVEYVMFVNNLIVEHVKHVKTWWNLEAQVEQSSAVLIEGQEEVLSK